MSRTTSFTDTLFEPRLQERNVPAHGWHPAALVLGCGFSIALLISWYFEPTRSLWLAVDEKVFWTLNGSLAYNKGWQVFWAVANNRAVDVGSALVMIGLFVHFWLRNRHRRAVDVPVLVAMFVALAVTAVQIGKTMDMGRHSPTLVHSGALRLSELVSGIPTKDISADSFPGDHAAVLFVFVGVVTYYLPRAYSAAAWIIAVLFISPRLVSGAHWLTDDLVGAAAIAVFILSSIFATPLHRFVHHWLQRLVGRIRRHAGSPRSGTEPC